MRTALKGCGLALAGLIGIGALAGEARGENRNENRSENGPSIVEIAAEGDRFTTLVKALGAADLVGTLQGEGPFTVFAPTDAAFAKLDQRSLARTLEPGSRDRLRSILTYHVVAGRLSSSDLAQRRTVTTLDGERLTLDFSGSLTVNGANVVSQDIGASNGVIHVIDAVLIPEKQTLAKVADNAGFKTLVTAAGVAGLVDALNANEDLTVFAPTDEAFAELGEEKIAELLRPENRGTLAQILKYHILPGRAYASDVVGGANPETLEGETIAIAGSPRGLTVNGANVVKADVNASNGVIHVIDRVLIPPSLAGAGPSEAWAGPGAGVSPTRVIELAIERGAPLFNDGQAGACAAIYEVAATSLLVLDGLNPDAEKALARGLRRIERTHDQRQRAWILREALDGAYEAYTRGSSSASRRH